MSARVVVQYHNISRFRQTLHASALSTIKLEYTDLPKINDHAVIKQFQFLWLDKHLGLGCATVRLVHLGVNRSLVSKARSQSVTGVSGLKSPGHGPG